MNRQLTRSRNRIIGGVAAGAAEWAGVDPALGRIAWALLVPITSGAALLSAALVAPVLFGTPGGSSSHRSADRTVRTGNA